MVQDRCISIDGPLMLAMVDRWRPEVHTFHLPCWDLTVTLQDVAMILGLHIDGDAVSRDMTSAGWQDWVEEFYGYRPPDPTKRGE